MKKILHKFNNTSLFFRVALITLICTICVFTFTTLITINISKNILVSTFSNLNYKILNQVKNSYSSVNDNIANILGIIENNSSFKKYLSTDDLDSKETYSLIYNMDKQLNMLSKDVYSDITIYITSSNNNMTFIKGHNYFSFDREEMLTNKITSAALRNNGKLVYQCNQYKNVNSNTVSSAITAAKVLKDKENHTIYGYVYIIIKEEDFSKYYKPFVGSSNSISIISNDGYILSSSIPGKIGSNDYDLYSISRKIISNNIDIYNTHYDSNNVAVLSTYLPYYDCYLSGIINKDIILNELFNTSKIIIVNIIIVFIFLICTFMIIRKITRPLSLLSYKMSKISDGNFKDYIKVEGTNEIRELSSAYNYMLDGLNKYIQDVLNMEKEKRQSEIHALQMQINPHFLYNTLSSIKWLIWQNENEKSIKTIDAFISLLRNTISNKNEMITIEEEINNLKNYVLINHIRYGNNINVNYFVQDICKNYKIPKLILQPFIENAFFHAFTDRDNGLISVFISLKNNNILCEIIDNGIGISKNNLSNILNSDEIKEHFTSIGINNVNERIKLIYGDEYGVTITSEINAGTSIKIIIPAD